MLYTREFLFFFAKMGLQILHHLVRLFGNILTARSKNLWEKALPDNFRVQINIFISSIINTHIIITGEKFDM